MSKKATERDVRLDDKQRFESLKPYMESVAKGNLKGQQIFGLCVRASAVKCFEFNLLAREGSHSHEAFFWVPSLRGICEDLIVLNFVKGMPREDREELMVLHMHLDVHDGIQQQDRFFTAERPQQPVLRIKDVATEIKGLEAKIQAIWKRHGWRGLKQKFMPPVRQIAEKQGEAALANLYDYLYRLTSAAVHFDVRSLLRSGWGSEPVKFSFSTRHFHPYYVAYTQVYGAFMFCVYFEFFGRYLRPGSKETETIGEIRKSILSECRWPEMVTFEEMNVERPKDSILQHVYSFMQAAKKKRLIS